MAATETRSALELLHAYRSRRDAESLDRLFRACYPLVLRIVELRSLRRLRGDREAEDFVQDSLLDVLRSLRHFAPRSEGEFRNWLAIIVANDLRDHERRAAAAKRGGKRVVRFSELPGPSPLERLIDHKPPPLAELGASELEARIERTLHALEEPYREALILRKLCGLSYGEIARHMGYAGPSSARSLCARAIRRLEELLERSPGAPRGLPRGRRKA
jgi:RNA polymerase sigma factor (sigma-70 family)